MPDNWVSNNLDPEPDCFNLSIDDLSIDECGICNGDNFELDCVGSDDCSLMDCSGPVSYTHLTLPTIYSV